MAEGDPLGDAEWPDFDVSKPNVARVYDAMLGGKDNFAADREFVAEVLRFAPMAPLGAISNRQFLRRVVQHLVVEAGVEAESRCERPPHLALHGRRGAERV